MARDPRDPPREHRNAPRTKIGWRRTCGAYGRCRARSTGTSTSTPRARPTSGEKRRETRSDEDNFVGDGACVCKSVWIHPRLMTLSPLSSLAIPCVCAVSLLSAACGAAAGTRATCTASPTLRRYSLSREIFHPVCWRRTSLRFCAPRGAATPCPAALPGSPTKRYGRLLFRTQCQIYPHRATSSGSCLNLRV